MPEYEPRWHCNVCGSYNVETIESARFNPNNAYAFVEMVESCSGYDWCNDCNEETTLDECEKNWKDWSDKENK